MWVFERFREICISIKARARDVNRVLQINETLCTSRCYACLDTRKWRIEERFNLRLNPGCFLLNRSVGWITDSTSCLNVLMLFWRERARPPFYLSIWPHELFRVRLSRSSFSLAHWNICARPWSLGLFLLFDIWDVLVAVFLPSWTFCARVGSQDLFLLSEFRIMFVGTVVASRTFSSIFEWKTVPDSFARGNSFSC